MKYIDGSLSDMLFLVCLIVVVVYLKRGEYTKMNPTYIDLVKTNNYLLEEIQEMKGEINNLIKSVTSCKNYIDKLEDRIILRNLKVSKLTTLLDVVGVHLVDSDFEGALKQIREEWSNYDKKTCNNPPDYRIKNTP